MNIDSQREVEWLEDIEIENRQIGIRINFDIEKMCPDNHNVQKMEDDLDFVMKMESFQKQ